MMDGSFFAFALIGALVGYIVGDFQRERRYRRQARANLALANKRANDRRAQRARHSVAFPVSDSDSDSNGDGPAFALATARHSEARRRAIRGDNNRAGSGAVPAGGDLRGADAATLVPAGGFDFDGD